MLDSSQVAFFREMGYLHLPGVLSKQELDDIRQAADALLAAKATLPAQWQEDFKYGALVGDDIGEGDQLCRIEYTLQKSPAFFRLIANPHVLATAASLHNSHIVLTWEDMIVKTPGAGFGVQLHQDLLHQSLPGPVMSIGLYLDDSADDPLMLIPGTQTLGPLDDIAKKRLISERSSEIIKLPVKAGDALVHNVLVVHGSHPNDSPYPRRVIYLEFRTVEQVLYSSPWGCEWLKRRLQYLPAAIDFRRNQSPPLDDPEALWADLLARKREWLADVPFQAYEQLDLRVHHQDFSLA